MATLNAKRRKRIKRGLYYICVRVCVKKDRKTERDREWVANIATCRRFNENVWLSCYYPSKRALCA